MPGAVSIATRSPDRRPRRYRSAATASIRSANSSKRSWSPVAMSTTAMSRSARRASIAAQGVSVDAVAPAPPASERSRGGAVNAVPAALDMTSAMNRSATVATSASAITRWLAPAKRCSTVFGIRPARSAAKSSLKTGSREPHASNTGAVTSPRRPATSARVCSEGCPGVNGMSSTKSAIAARAGAVRYGARNADRSAAVIRLPDRRNVASTNVGDP